MGSIIDIKNLETLSQTLRQQGKKIILAGGCFDILHKGHVEFLEKSKHLSGVLIIFLESDASIRQIKGPGRPVNTQDDRAILLSKLDMIDYIIPLPPLLRDGDYLHLVKKIKPDIIAITKGDKNKEKKLVQANSVHAKLIEVVKVKKNYSTSNIIKNIKNQ